MSTKPKSNPTTTRSPSLFTEIEIWERKKIHHPSPARFRQPKVKKIERKKVFDEIGKKIRERERERARFGENKNWERKREYGDIRKRKRGKRELDNFVFNSKC